MNLPLPARRQNMRAHISYRLARQLTARGRVEQLWYNMDGAKEKGFLAYAEGIYKPDLKLTAAL